MVNIPLEVSQMHRLDLRQWKDVTEEQESKKENCLEFHWMNEYL